jgi:beta-ureidopropionase / N-carbamoyl-L-amino-acid hydrolase
VTSPSDHLVAELGRALAELAPHGYDPATGGYRRFAWTEADAACRGWFRRQARLRSMPIETDRNGNLWAWWPRPPTPAARAVATGSHLDSVPDGGAFDGPLGVISALLAVDILAGRPATGLPVGVAVFADEEGARFGVACAGSRLMTGAIDPSRARALRDPEGVTLAEALRQSGIEPEGIGGDEEMIGRLGAFVELHIEQGRALADLDAPVGIATAIWPHGRWRVDLAGEANHAGTTRLEHRRDPMLPLAEAVLAAREAAAAEGALATIGRVLVTPGATNAVPSGVVAWLDARAAAEDTLDRVVAQVREALERAAARHGVTALVTEESRSPAVELDGALRRRMADALGAVPEIPTGAGHDAGILAARLPTGMLFVRNRTGTSHSPAETADLEDCAAGVRALAAVLAELTGR